MQYSQDSKQSPLPPPYSDLRVGESSRLLSICSKEVDSNDTESSFQVLLHDLQPGTTENGLRSLMGRFGVSTKVVVDERKHEALATFSSEKAIQAVWMDYFLFKGVNLGISFPEDSEERYRNT